ncbi:TonB-dependent siderophore receptor [Thermomonas sp.]|uniref:TonB-dependent receptor n=1 Tax=Thermomonas sp. TaxID=1971895 RepID=UPI0024893B4F|nr:TonB-dependent siderophore receptor [Thermomonas sp.]MDI1251917.1 TonB-dependent siderophore receptor [Thermomonas sp.]
MTQITHIQQAVPRQFRNLLASAILLVLIAPAAGFAAGAPVDSPSSEAVDENPKDLDRVKVVGDRYLPDYAARSIRGATKTDTPLLDVPQAVTVVTDKLVADQGITSMGDAFRYMPGVGTAQGEGNRDTPVLRGNSTTADFFVDGIRDDVQYFRDVYNLERVEALKGANAMIFGRGGSGGVINRVTRQADGMDHRSGSVQFGANQRRRGTLDYGTGIGSDAGFRINAMYENSGSFRDGVNVKRYGANPTFGIDFGKDTRLQLSYERFHDERTADRGIPSFQGKPVVTDPSTFFGNPALSVTATTVDAFDVTLDRAFSDNFSLRNHLRWADYDKMYQNVFPSSVDATGTLVTLAAYSNATQRRNLFNQTDLVWKLSTGSVQHTILAGAELGRQVTENFRQTGYFSAGSSVVPLANPTVNVPVEFRQSATDADNHGVATVAAFYLQDQIELSPRWQAIIGLRHDDFRVDLRNNRTAEVLRSEDSMLSPRAGLVYKPLDNVSFYASYSKAFQPRAGDQLASLKADNASLTPETSRNREIGAKWDLKPDLQASLAVYRLDRGNVAVADPADVTKMVLVDGQYVRGVELGLAGRVTDAWQLMGGYAYQAGEITATQSATAIRGNRLAQLPRNSASLWNRYDINQTIGVGLGIVYRGSIYANVDNTVALPAFTRFDGAIYWTLNPALQLQLNIENLANTRYFASAHSNNNISPGAPRSAWVSLNYHF